MKFFILIFFTTSLLFTHAYAQKSNASLNVNAVNLIEKGKFQEAKALLEKIKGPNNSKDLLFLLGFVYLKTGMYEDAVSSFKEYETKRPDNDEYHYYYGISLYETKQYDAALEEFHKCSLIGVREAQSYYYAGYISFLRDDCNTALPLFVNALKEDSEYNTLAHYYAGVCLYRKGFEDKSAFEASIYHFEKVADEKGVKQEDAKGYIISIDEYLSGGAIRHKKRYNVGSDLNIGWSSNRTITPVDGMPIIGVDSAASGMWGSFIMDLGASPLLYDNFAMFINYSFDTDLALSNRITNTNVQAHKPGVSFQFFNQKRTFEAYVGYKYEFEYLEQQSFNKVYSAHAISAGFDQSITSTWSLGISVPVYLYSAENGALGDFSGKSIEFILVSQHLLGATSFKIEPSILFYLAGTGTVASYRHYRVAAKFNLPWEVFFLWPSLKIAPGRLATNTGYTSTYDFGISLFRPIGLGMKFNIFCDAKKGFVSQSWDVRSGVSLEYLFQ